jgi:hypothetical protein
MAPESLVRNSCMVAMQLQSAWRCQIILGGPQRARQAYTCQLQSQDNASPRKEKQMLQENVSLATSLAQFQQSNLAIMMPHEPHTATAW